MKMVTVKPGPRAFQTTMAVVEEAKFLMHLKHNNVIRSSSCQCPCQEEGGRERERGRVCVCVCVHVYMCVCVCVRVRVARTPQHHDC